jgi:hypothetical protein
MFFEKGARGKPFTRKRFSPCNFYKNFLCKNLKFAAFREECFYERETFLPQNAGKKIDGVVIAARFEYTFTARFVVGRTVIEVVYARIDYRARAHRAGFEGNEHIAVVEPPSADFFFGFFNRLYLRVT